MDVCDLNSESDSNHELSESESESSNPSSEDDENSSIVQSFQSPPLFVLPPSSEVFKSDITHYEHLLAVNALVISGNLSSLVLENVLDLIKLHVPMNNLCEENVSDLKKKLGFDKDYLKNFHTSKLKHHQQQLHQQQQQYLYQQQHQIKQQTHEIPQQHQQQFSQLQTQQESSTEQLFNGFTKVIKHRDHI
ncbi:putative uncharacterized protein DDB_G0294196 [Argopecten irradians]|uniref:putative uncharacterized protein DDB_G0294196 n=1 Tax=Argopecten irradians TaxID=31199 RepID=UPI0037194747